MSSTNAELRDLPARIGETVGVSDWLLVSQEDVDTFAEITHDRQWIHVDAARATAGPFGAPIAHGYLILSYCTTFLAQTLEVSGVSAIINYGLNRVRFVSPVPVGSRLRGSVQLASVKPIEGGADAVFVVTVEREGGDRPVCVAEIIGRYLC